MITAQVVAGPSASTLEEPSAPPPTILPSLDDSEARIAKIEETGPRWQGFVAGTMSGATKLLVGHPLDTVSKLLIHEPGRQVVSGC